MNRVEDISKEGCESRAKGRLQVAVRGALVIIRDNAQSKVCEYINDLKNKLKAWSQMPKMVKERLEELAPSR